MRDRTGWPLVVDPNVNPEAFVHLAGFIGLETHVPTAICILPAGHELPEDELPFVYAPSHIWSEDAASMDRRIQAGLLETARSIMSGGMVLEPDGEALKALNDAMSNFERDTGRQYVMAVAVEQSHTRLTSFWLNGVLIRRENNPESFFLKLLGRYLEKQRLVMPLPASANDGS